MTCPFLIRDKRLLCIHLLHQTTRQTSYNKQVYCTVNCVKIEFNISGAFRRNLKVFVSANIQHVNIKSCQSFKLLTCM
jgi:hypothetical protein